ncbi:aldolase/citrate lyase family protein [Alkalihalobacillus oceani]|uniref:HpcH/HpaI aldolase family protein n=1 Tax=Halalkalibacter oceani TaxID=1653776 RepID=UPI002041F06C|nr:aldolase/citrate lyase family protein [Halalkalibacter oceani]MCM3761132.1 aldolase/citrate lyase family protein [Halalkalibacter oceani]
MKNRMERNRVKETIERGEVSFGFYVATPSPTIVELAGVAGMEWVRIDWAHSAVDLPMIENMIRAAESYNMAPFVRLNLDQQKISSVLELGALGIIVPDIETADDARKIVNAAKFSPVGDRGMFSAPRKSGYGAVDGASFKKWTNEEVMVGIQIENVEAIDQLEDILDVEGVDIVLSGRGDLANALGVPGQRNHPDVLRAEEEIFHIARKKGKVISPQLDPTAADFQTKIMDWKGKGAQVISFGHDLPIIKHALEQIVQRAATAEEVH